MVGNALNEYDVDNITVTTASVVCSPKTVIMYYLNRVACKCDDEKRLCYMIFTAMKCF